MIQSISALPSWIRQLGNPCTRIDETQFDLPQAERPHWPSAAVNCFAVPILLLAGAKTIVYGNTMQRQEQEEKVPHSKHGIFSIPNQRIVMLEGSHIKVEEEQHEAGVDAQEQEDSSDHAQQVDRPEQRFRFRSQFKYREGGRRACSTQGLWLLDSL
jgi:hypothetical protein